MRPPSAVYDTFVDLCMITFDVIKKRTYYYYYTRYIHLFIVKSQICTIELSSQIPEACPITITTVNLNMATGQVAVFSVQ
jgi:hypothetical protein